MGKFDNVTIIIPTYNRPRFLRRLTNYYDSYDKHFGIIVADSSSDENKKLNREIVSSVSNLAIIYIDRYAQGIHPYEKFAQAVNMVDTEYCVLCADDDFIAPEGIALSTAFLTENSDFAVAHGRYFAFHLETDDKGKRLSWAPAYSHRSILSPNAEERLEQHLSSYSQPTIYGVHRAELIKMVYKETLKSKADLYYFGELLLSMLTIIYGKMQCLDVFYAARSADSVVAGGYWPTLKAAIETGIYDGEYDKFRERVATHLSEQSQLDTERAMKLVDRAMSAYLKKYFFSKSKIAPLTTKTGLFLDRLNLPGWLDKGIRKPYKRVAGSNDINEKVMDESIFSNYPEDFNRIRHHVLDSSEIGAENRGLPR